MSKSIDRTIAVLFLIALCGGTVGCEAICAIFNIPTENCIVRNGGPGNPSLQDLQVAIEVRFVAVDDDFFERIGVDFDFDIDDQADFGPAGDAQLDSDAAPIDPFIGNASDLGGADNTRLFSPDAYDAFSHFLPTVPNGQTGTTLNVYPRIPPKFDIPLNRTLASNEFKGVSGGLTISDPWTDVDVSSFGFAILSEIQAMVFLEAAKNDSGNSVLEAPKVTLFDGQTAAVISKNETTVAADLDPPFATALTTVAPSVQTVISGPMLIIEPVVSSDRQTIQLRVQPIRGIQFPFPMSVTDNGQPASIEFPIIQVSNIQTMVSVPDGGTILLGGLRRMSDNGMDRGVPILNKVPYINRLFRNTATVKESQTLLLMVTPRIIIQEEEEQ